VNECKCGCRREVKVKGRVYFSSKCLGRYLRTQSDAGLGRYQAVFAKYMNEFASGHYRNVDGARHYLCHFFRYLNENEVASLDAVTTSTITDYLGHIKRTVPRPGNNYISSVRRFFNWMLITGQRKDANPVVNRFHYPPKVHRLPRPFTKDELDTTWRLLNERGDLRLRLAVAIGEEVGLRIGEVCNLRMCDVNVEEQSLFVRLPNKTNRERSAFFSVKTKGFLMEWLAERNPDCGHDFLLYNGIEGPYAASVLRNALRMVLCKSVKRKRVNDTGFDEWSFHRLRHTMASKLIAGGATAIVTMGQGGWASHNSMAGYVSVDAAMVSREYYEVQRRLSEQKQIAPRTRSLTPAELLRRHGVETDTGVFQITKERCV
jgi:integrase/recombinase XerC